MLGRSQAGAGFGQLALRRPLSRLSVRSRLRLPRADRPASADQPLGPLLSLYLACSSSQVLRQRDGVLRLIDYGGAETFFRGGGLDKARCYYLLVVTIY